MHELCKDQTPKQFKGQNMNGVTSVLRLQLPGQWLSGTKKKNEKRVTFPLNLCHDTKFLTVHRILQQEFVGYSNRTNSMHNHYPIFNLHHESCTVKTFSRVVAISTNCHDHDNVCLFGACHLL